MTVYQIKIRESIERIAKIEVADDSACDRSELLDQLVDLAEDVAVESDRGDRIVEIDELVEPVVIDARL